jgi:hypothetical protein
MLMSGPLDYESRDRKEAKPSAIGGIGCAITSFLSAALLVFLIVWFSWLVYESRHVYRLGAMDFTGPLLELASILVLLISVVAGVFGLASTKREQRFARSLCWLGLAIAIICGIFGCIVVFSDF